MSTATPTVFDLCVTHILELEGGYVNNPSDPGGRTNFGISQRSYPDLDIKSLTREQAINIYRRDYWLPVRCGEIPAPLAAFLFDANIQHGKRRAIRMLQAPIDASVDGVIGPATIAKANQADLRSVLPSLFAARTIFYKNICTKKGFLFFNGWMSRMCQLQQFIYLDLMNHEI